jgi:hypothetical protein
MIHTRLGDDGTTPYVTARIVDQTAFDPSVSLDTPLSLDYCGNDVDCTVALSMKDGQPNAVANTGSPAGTTIKGGAGSGGVFPFPGGLPIAIPNPFKLPALPTWLYWAAGGIAAVIVIGEVRK